MYEDFTHLNILSNANNLWIAGDFNLPDINWNNMSVIGTIYPINMNKFFIDTIQEIRVRTIANNYPFFRFITTLVKGVFDLQEEFEDTKGAIRICISKKTIQWPKDTKGVIGIRISKKTTQ